jgi:hypothetical protein
MSTTSWLMPNKMIDIARARNLKTKSTSRPVVVQCLSEQEITRGLDEKTSNALLKAHTCFKDYKNQRAEKKIKVIDFIEVVNEGSSGSKTLSRANRLKCQAKTMAGKPCPFRASCGKFCKKHQQPEEFKI